MKLRLDARPPERVAADLTAVAVASDELTRLRRVRAVGPVMARTLARQRFTGAAGTSALVRAGAHGVRRALVILGLGPAGEIDGETIRRAAGQLVARAREVGARRAAVAVVHGRRPPALAEPDMIEALVEGAVLASYVFAEYRRDPERVRLGSLVVAGVRDPATPMLRRALRRGEVLGTATNRAREWINLPAAVMTPTALADEAARAARAAGLEVHCEGPRAIARRGMGALLGVASGSAEEPRFIRLIYRPPGGRRGRRRARRLALVGKGITFDSGGLSLKTVGGMEHMKRDMAGGAAVIATMLAIAALKPPVEVRAYVPASENLPGGRAMKPGDVLRTAAGTTVEVLNTDAEGRLVLADALAIAVAEAPDAIVDIATLTGAVRSALGTRIGGIMGNDAALVAALVTAGRVSGERLWELPLVAAYRPDLESAVADLRNVAPGAHGGAIHAGLFLEEFVAGRPWAHLDVAGVAFTDRDLAYASRGGVGFGVRLLTRWVLAAAEDAARAWARAGARPATTSGRSSGTWRGTRPGGSAAARRSRDSWARR